MYGNTFNIELPLFRDERGSLVPIELESTLPFRVERLYYIFGCQTNQTRGAHAHKSLKQCFICLVGECVLELDNGNYIETYRLNQPAQGRIIEGLFWRNLHSFSEDCILLVLADQPYDAKDYIHDYEAFLAATRLA
jgi:dTDP-4-dehydrorhamnose 3,5-epimerase-like enzyme